MSQKIPSPWLKNLKRTRPANPLQEDCNCDVAVVGAGISGVATSYFLLRDTELDVVLLEKERVAQGATGHNGGQALAGFEQSLKNLCQIFGEEMVSDGMKAIEGAWDLLYSMISETRIDIDIQEVSASMAFSSVDDVLEILQERRMLERLGIAGEDIILAEEMAEKIPEEYRDLFTIKRSDVLADILHTEPGRFICLQKTRMALMNSALFCEEIVSWMIKRYPDRFCVFENTAVQTIKPGSKSDGAPEGAPEGTPGGAILITGTAADEKNAPGNAPLEEQEAIEMHKAEENTACGQSFSAEHSVYARHVVLCTNGYNNLKIEGIDDSILNRIYAVLGFMIGYLEEEEKEPLASAYFDSRWHNPDDGYYYLSRRRYIDNSKRSLICAGGEDRNLNENERRCYNFIAGIKEHYSRIESFYRDTIKGLPQGRSPDLSWNGLMGYTQNRVRLIGPDPADPSLIYNLGCNGIGILPAIYGGKRVAQLLAGVKLAPSMFDPNLLLRRAP